MNEDLLSPPEIDYLAKDYASFRQLMLDHFALRVPDWNERSEADLGITMIEVLAYVADYLSYYQDAVATEAYLGTARRRPSIKRQVRLLDYVLHEGCNARAWVQVQVNAPLVLSQATQLLTGTGETGQNTLILPQSNAYDEVLRGEARVFETMHTMQLYPQHNEIRLYVEEGEVLELSAGSTSALLYDPGAGYNAGLRLRAGDVLVFEEIKSSVTGATAGADPARRHAVRLTGSTRRKLGDQHVRQVFWHAEDALPLSLRVAVRQEGDLIENICVARGNMILADHGRTLRHEILPSPRPQQRYRPSISQPGLAAAVPYHHEQAVKQPAYQFTRQDARAALPLIALFQQSRSVPLDVDMDAEISLDALTLSDSLRRQLSAAGIVLSQHVSVRFVPGVGWELHDILREQYWLVVAENGSLSFSTFNKWRLRRDLLSSNPLARDYTVDMEEDRRAILRFGFGAQGKQPQPGDRFRATYRLGGGEQGNVRADTITRIVTTETAISAVRNPLPAQGGTDAEALETARDLAPYAFRTPECCVNEEDYATVARHYPQVMNAVAHLTWPGNSPLVALYVQRKQRKHIDRAFMDELGLFLEKYRLAGHAFALRGPSFVGLRVALTVWLQRSSARNPIEMALTRILSNTPEGFFAPDNFTFGQPVYQSQLLAALMAVPGVERVEIEQFCRFDTTPATCEEVILPGPLEIVRLDNDAAAAYNGRLFLRLEGGL